MPVNRNALIRYHTIDKCLQNHFRKWTLEDLIRACSDALYEYEGINRPISRRTIQTDIQMMRSEKLGYKAPIIVVDRKYYTYADKEYSISNSPLREQDLAKLTEVVNVLRQFKGFSQFEELLESVQKLEDKVYAAKEERQPFLEFDKNSYLKGLSFLDPIYRAIQERKVLDVTYRSFTAKTSTHFSFHPYLLKQFNNRWFVLGYMDEKQPAFTIALDRIVDLDTSELPYQEEAGYDLGTYYQDVVGVTVNKGVPVQEVRFLVRTPSAPYVRTKPFHPSQVIVEEREDGTVFAIQVRPNQELERLILSYGENIQVLAPEKLKERIGKRTTKAAAFYENNDAVRK